MLTWIVNNIASILICAVLVTVITLVIVKLVKDKKAGKSSCGCNCSCCPMAGKCHPSAGKKAQHKPMRGEASSGVSPQFLQRR